MTRKRNDEHSTEFGLWLREQKELDSRKEKYTATNLDFIWSNYGTKKYMLLEEKRKMSKCTWSQYNLYKTLSDKIDDENLLQYIIPSDLKTFGLIPEIIGRLPALTFMRPLDKKTLRSILTVPKNAIIKQYTRLFEMDGITFEIDEKALDFIVDKAVEYKLGARGLRSLCEEILTDAMFDMPGGEETSLKVSLKYAKDKLTKTTIKKLKAVS
mgnify:CR=1 FL=1